MDKASFRLFDSSKCRQCLRHGTSTLIAWNIYFIVKDRLPYDAMNNERTTRTTIRVFRDSQYRVRKNKQSETK
jgi:hypothetical protein